MPSTFHRTFTKLGLTLMDGGNMVTGTEYIYNAPKPARKDWKYDVIEHLVKLGFTQMGTDLWGNEDGYAHHYVHFHYERNRYVSLMHTRETRDAPVKGRRKNRKKNPTSESKTL